MYPVNAIKPWVWPEREPCVFIRLIELFFGSGTMVRIVFSLLRGRGFSPSSHIALSLCLGVACAYQEAFSGKALYQCAQRRVDLFHQL